MKALELPVLSRVMSPNYSSRGGAKVRLIVIHDCEGSYNGSISWFSQAKSRVSAHIVLNEAGTAATQCVAFANKAWHACSFNPVSEGIEAAGYAVKGLAAAEWQALANITAYRLRANGLPPVWSRDGSGEGYCQHRDLGSAGGGHTDITSDPSTWVAFQTMVEEAYKQPMPSSWTSSGILPVLPHAPIEAPRFDHRHDHSVGSLEWVQLSLNALAIHGPAMTPLVVDGLDGPDTRFAIRQFQRREGLEIDGDAGPVTCAALFKAMENPNVKRMATAPASDNSDGPAAQEHPD